MEDLNKRVSKLELMDIYKTLQLIIRSYTFLSIQNIYEISPYTKSQSKLQQMADNIQLTMHYIYISKDKALSC